MIRRNQAILVFAAAAAMLVAACGGSIPGPALTDPKAIVTAALRSTEAAKTVHIEVAVDGNATVAMPIGGGTGTPVDLTGTTASANVDFANEAAKATFSVSKFGIAGEVIAVGGKSYVKTTLTGPLYQESPAGSSPVDPAIAGSIIDNLGDLLLKPGVTLSKGDDVACGSKQCYTVTTTLTAQQLGLSAGGVAGLPVDVAGATITLTVRVEKDLPYHLAGVTAILSMANATSVKLDLTASKWDEPVSIEAPPADEVKPAS
jgi:hypothetical protein